MGGDYLTTESEEVKNIFSAIDQARKTLQLAAARNTILQGRKFANICTSRPEPCKRSATRGRYRLSQ